MPSVASSLCHWMQSRPLPSPLEPCWIPRPWDTLTIPAANENLVFTFWPHFQYSSCRDLSSLLGHLSCSVLSCPAPLFLLVGLLVSVTFSLPTQLLQLVVSPDHSLSLQVHLLFRASPLPASIFAARSYCFLLSPPPLLSQSWQLLKTSWPLGQALP